MSFLSKPEQLRPLNLIENTAMVRRRSDGAFLGSGVLFRYCDFVLTAEHVVNGIAADDLAVEFPGSRAASLSFPCVQLWAHPKADLCVLRIEPPNERDVTWVHTDFWDDRMFGVDIMTFGFPDIFDGAKAEPVPRFHKGYSQRYFDYSSGSYSYEAVELSFGCPHGLSGAPLINSVMDGRLYGLVTENIEVGTQRHSFTDVDDDGKEYRETTHRILNYGIGVYLPPLQNWVDGIIHPVSTAEIQRRTENQRNWR